MLLDLGVFGGVALNALHELHAERAMRELNGAQREELKRRFAVFVNAGGVDVQVNGPPF